MQFLHPFFCVITLSSLCVKNDFSFQYSKTKIIDNAIDSIEKHKHYFKTFRRTDSDVTYSYLKDNKSIFRIVSTNAFKSNHKVDSVTIIIYYFLNHELSKIIYDKELFSNKIERAKKHGRVHSYLFNEKLIGEKKFYYIPEFPDLTDLINQGKELYNKGENIIRGVTK